MRGAPCRCRWRELGVHGGDPLTRAGDVLALVPQFPSAAPEQAQALRDLRPLEPALPMPVGRTGVRGGIWVTYSDMLQLVLAESPELPPNVHVGLSTAGISVRDHTSTKDTLSVEIRNIGLMFSCLTRALAYVFDQSRSVMRAYEHATGSSGNAEIQRPGRHIVSMHVHMQRRSVARHARLTDI
jgi:hypothetical protein